MARMSECFVMHVEHDNQLCKLSITRIYLAVMVALGGVSTSLQSFARMVKFVAAECS